MLMAIQMLPCYDLGDGATISLRLWIHSTMYIKSEVQLTYAEAQRLTMPCRRGSALIVARSKQERNRSVHVAEA